MQHVASNVKHAVQALYRNLGDQLHRIMTMSVNVSINKPGSENWRFVCGIKASSDFSSKSNSPFDSQADEAQIWNWSFIPVTTLILLLYLYIYKIK